MLGIRFWFVAAIAALVLGSSAANVFAAPRKPPAACVVVDDDHDGWPSAIHLTVSACLVYVASLDCNDHDAAVYPGAKEILGNSIDEDCDGAAVPYVDEKWKPFGCGKEDVRCAKRAEAETNACTAATPAKCVVSWSNGRVVPTSGHRMADKNCDGIRESVLNDAEFEKWTSDTRTSRGDPSWTPTPAGYCPSSGAGSGRRQSSATGTGPARPRATAPRAPRPDPTLAPKVTALEKRAADLEKGASDTATVLHGAVDDIVVLGRELERERDERKADVARLETDIGTVKARADDAHDLAEKAGRAALQINEDVEGLRGIGVTVSLNVGLSLKVQSDFPVRNIDTGEVSTARGSLAPILTITGVVGYEDPTVVAAMHAIVGVPYDEGPGDGREAGLLWGVGVEACAKIGDHCIGGVARYFSHASGGDVNGANVYSQGGSGGLFYMYSPYIGDSQRFRFPIRVTLEGGAESIGVKGAGVDEQVFEAGLFMGTLSIGLGLSPADSD